MPIPVPPQSPGYRLGSGDAPTQIEVFLDLECPFSKKAWPTMLALVNQNDSDRLAICAHMIVLCDHRQSWDLTKALAAIAGRDALKGWKFVSYLYQHQQEFNSAAFQTKTRQDLISLIGHFIKAFGPDLPAANLSKDVSDDNGAFANQAKASIRYAIDRKVWSTPTFFVNGSEVPTLESSSTIQDWQTFLGSL